MYKSGDKFIRVRPSLTKECNIGDVFTVTDISTQFDNNFYCEENDLNWNFENFILLEGILGEELKHYVSTRNKTSKNS